MTETRLETLFEVLGDSTSRTIISLLHDGPRTAKSLEEDCNVSLKTVYRRLATLQELGLVSRHTRFDESGNQNPVYTTDLDEIEVTMTPEDLDVEIVLDEGDEVDRMIGVWTEMQG